MQNSPRQLAMHSCALFLYVRCRTPNQIKKLALGVRLPIFSQYLHIKYGPEICWRAKVCKQLNKLDKETTPYNILSIFIHKIRTRNPLQSNGLWTNILALLDKLFRKRHLIYIIQEGMSYPHDYAWIMICFGAKILR